MAKTKKEIEAMIWDNIPTETNLRRWQKRLIVAKTKPVIEKCKFKIKLYERV